jgi:hypothetical protein
LNWICWFFCMKPKNAFFCGFVPQPETKSLRCLKQRNLLIFKWEMKWSEVKWSEVNVLWNNLTLLSKLLEASICPPKSNAQSVTKLSCPIHFWISTKFYCEVEVSHFIWTKRLISEDFYLPEFQNPNSKV